MPEAVSPAPAIGFSITVQLDDKHAIVAQTHVDQTAPISDINAVVDKVMAVMQRKEDQGELEMWKRRLYSSRTNVDMLEGDIKRQAAASVDEWQAQGKRGPYKASPQSVTAANTLKASLERSATDIKIAEERIAELEDRLKGPHLRVA